MKTTTPRLSRILKIRHYQLIDHQKRLKLSRFGAEVVRKLTEKEVFLILSCYSSDTVAHSQKKTQKSDPGKNKRGESIAKFIFNYLNTHILRTYIFIYKYKSYIKMPENNNTTTTNSNKSGNNNWSQWQSRRNNRQGQRNRNNNNSTRKSYNRPVTNKEKFKGRVEELEGFVFDSSTRRSVDRFNEVVNNIKIYVNSKYKYAENILYVL